MHQTVQTVNMQLIETGLFNSDGYKLLFYSSFT